MSRHSFLRQPAALALGIGLAAMASTGLAQAACTSFDSPVGSPAARAAPARFAPAVFLPGTARAFNISFGNSQEQAGIVGMWRFEMIAKSTRNNTNPMPDGALIDFGYSQWHDDGTEIMNSGAQNPADSNFCLGTWSQTGPNSYALLHLPLAWHNGTYAGPVVIREQVTLGDDGNSFRGTFKTAVYAAAELPGAEFNLNIPVVTITGTITATRVTVN